MDTNRLGLFPGTLEAPYAISYRTLPSKSVGGWGHLHALGPYHRLATNRPALVPPCAVSVPNISFRERLRRTLSQYRTSRSTRLAGYLGGITRYGNDFHSKCACSIVAACAVPVPHNAHTAHGSTAHHTHVHTEYAMAVPNTAHRAHRICYASTAHSAHLQGHPPAAPDPP
eukprot:1191631-Rhodomonas_salina.3